MHTSDPKHPPKKILTSPSLKKSNRRFGTFWVVALFDQLTTLFLFIPSVTKPCYLKEDIQSKSRSTFFERSHIALYDWFWLIGFLFLVIVGNNLDTTLICSQT